MELESGATAASEESESPPRSQASQASAALQADYARLIRNQSLQSQLGLTKSGIDLLEQMVVGDEESARAAQQVLESLVGQSDHDQRSQEADEAVANLSAEDESYVQKRVHRLKEDCRIALEAQQSEVQQEGRRSGSALDVGGSSSAGASSLSATPTCGQDAERTTTVPCYAGASMNTDVRPLRLRGPPRYGVYPRGWKPGMVFFIPFSDQKLADRFEVGAEGISYFLGANMVFYVGKKAANPGSASVHRSVATIRACAACWSPDPPMCPSCTKSMKQKKARVVTHEPVFRFF